MHPIGSRQRLLSRSLHPKESSTKPGNNERKGIVKEITSKGNLAFRLRISYAQRKINKTGYQINVGTTEFE